jgi:hypothetical protein
MQDADTKIRKPSPAIFIVGMARSGTTLLSEILNAHSKIAVSPETHYFRKYWVDEQNFPLEKRIALIEEFIDGDEFKQFGYSQEQKKEIRMEALNAVRKGQSQILDIVLTRYRLKHNKPVWCEKTPVHMLYLPQIAKLFPESKFICLVRDPRDTCLSLKKVPFNAGSTVSIARRWKKYAGLAVYYQTEYIENFLVVKYEDLIRQPEQQVMKICQFLNIDYQSEMLNQNKGPATFDGEKEHWKLNAIKPIDKNNYDKWKHEMKPGEIYFLQKYLCREMERYNYDIQPELLNLNVLRQLVAIAAHWCLTVLTNLSLRMFGVRKYNW